MIAALTDKVTLAFFYFPGWDAFWPMIAHAFWWGLAIAAAIILLIPVIVIVAFIFSTVWTILQAF